MERAKKYLEQAIETAAESTSELLTVLQVSDWLQLSPKTLQRKRTDGSGPQFVKPSRNAVRYKRGAVQSWLDDRTGSSTADFSNGAE